jgi:hypothetical protein
METEPRPDRAYTNTWSPAGEIEYATLTDGRACDTSRPDPARR